MNPAELPLRDIHLPQQVGWWPPAPGWWLIAALLIIAGVAAWLYVRRRSARLKRRIARELAALLARWRAAHDHAAFLSGLSALLRRSAIALDGRATSAGLSGSRWQQYLNRDLTDQPFSEHPGSLLIDGAYRPHLAPLSEDDATALAALVRRWLDEARHDAQVGQP